MSDQTNQELNSKAELYKALAAAQSEFKNPATNKEVEVAMNSGRKYKFKYADLASCYDINRQTLAKNGLSHFTLLKGNSVLVTLAHVSGQSVSSEWTLSPERDPKLRGAEITYAKRYLFVGLLGVCADDDVDAPPSDDVVDLKMTNAEFKGSLNYNWVLDQIGYLGFEELLFDINKCISE